MARQDSKDRIRHLRDSLALRVNTLEFTDEAVRIGSPHDRHDQDSAAQGDAYFLVAPCARPKLGGYDGGEPMHREKRLLDFIAPFSCGFDVLVRHERGDCKRPERVLQAASALLDRRDMAEEEP